MSDSLRSPAFALTAYGSHYSPRDSPANESIANGNVSARESSVFILNDRDDTVAESLRFRPGKPVDWEPKTADGDLLVRK